MKVAQEASLLGNTKSEHANAPKIASHMKKIFREILMVTQPSECISMDRIYACGALKSISNADSFELPLFSCRKSQKQGVVKFEESSFFT